MSDIIEDFINSKSCTRGYGFWEGNSEASKFAKTITMNQEKCYRRHGRIPKAFKDFLRQSLKFDLPKRVDTEFDGPEHHRHPRTKDPANPNLDFLEYLFQGRCSDSKYEQEVESIIVAALLDRKTPRQLFKADAGHVWFML